MPADEPPIYIDPLLTSSVFQPGVAVLADETTSTRVPVPGFPQKGAYVIKISTTTEVRSVVFAVARANSAVFGIVNRVCHSTQPTGAELSAEWEAGQDFELFHSVTDPGGGPVTYTVQWSGLD